MPLGDAFRQFVRGMREGVNPRVVEEAKPTTPEARALAAAHELTEQAQKLPIGSPTRMRLNGIAEELRAYAAGENAKTRLADLLDDPAIRQVLKSAGIRLD